MPYSPMVRYPDIIKTLRLRGKTSRVQTEDLKLVVMEVLGVIHQKSIEHNIEAMVQTNYVKLDPVAIGVWMINPFFDQSKRVQKPFTVDDLNQYGIENVGTQEEREKEKIDQAKIQADAESEADQMLSGLTG